LPKFAQIYSILPKKILLREAATFPAPTALKNSSNYSFYHSIEFIKLNLLKNIIIEKHPNTIVIKSLLRIF